MKNRNEHLAASEIPEFSESENAGQHLEAHTVERHRSVRRAQLRDIERDIGWELLQAVQSKIEYEERLLKSLIERAHNTHMQKEVRHGVLKSEYFIRKPLPQNIF